MMTTAVLDRTVDEARRVLKAFKAMMSIHEGALDGAPPTGVTDGEEPISLGDLEALRGVVKFPVRIKCALLPWAALEEGIARFLDGRYAWAMPHAGMVAYVFERSNTCPVSSLRRYFKRSSNGVPIAERVGCAELPAKVSEAPGANAADVALTRHSRALMPAIDLRHLWLS